MVAFPVRPPGKEATERRLLLSRADAGRACRLLVAALGEWG